MFTFTFKVYDYKSGQYYAYEILAKMYNQGALFAAGFGVGTAETIAVLLAWSFIGFFVVLLPVEIKIEDKEI